VEFDRFCKFNVLPPLLLTQAVQPCLPQDRSGKIVNISSVLLFIGYHRQSVYTSIKAALEAMAQVWSCELTKNAMVNAFNPGPALGDMYEKAGPTFWKINHSYVNAAPLAAYTD
jgi:3-oxoacyl-[acyl-carrier protein] reductase